MINESELREMSSAERRRLARALATIDYSHPLLGIYLARGRRLGFLVSIASCAVLAGWLVALALTLHRSFHTHYWRGAWVGYDFILVSAFAATGWAFWRGRQIVIACLLVTGTLLCCDAWFDVVLDLGTSDIWGSVASALLVELPMALLMFEAARRLIRLSALVAMSESGGLPGPRERKSLPPLWKIPLFGVRGDRPGGRSPDAGGKVEGHTTSVVDQQARGDLGPVGELLLATGCHVLPPGAHPLHRDGPRPPGPDYAHLRRRQQAHRVRHGIRSKESPWQSTSTR